jgi:hypothetical protein
MAARALLRGARRFLDPKIDASKKAIRNAVKVICPVATTNVGL